MPLGGDTARASVFATVFKAQAEKASGEVLSPSIEFVFVVERAGGDVL